MKQDISFSSLPTGAHLHLSENGGTRFVFKNPEKTDSIDVSEQSVNYMVDRLHTKSEIRNETNAVRTDVENSEKRLTPQELRKESDRMRAEVAERAKEKLEKEFVKLDEALGKKLVELYGAPSGKSNPEDVKIWIQNHVASLSQSEREVFVTKLQTEVENEIKNNEFFKMADNLSGLQKGAKAVNDEVLKIGDVSMKERAGNFLGAGLTTLYIVGLFSGAAKPYMWWSGLAVGGLAAAAPGAAEGLFKGTDWVLDKAGNAANFSFTHLKNALVGVARLDTNQMWDGTTETDDRRAEMFEKFQSVKAPRPGLTMPVQNEKGEWVEMEMIDETMHQRFQSIPLEKITPKNRLKPEQCDQAAQFCVDVFDPSIIITDKTITPEQRLKIANLTQGDARFDYLDPETLQLISRTFASREAVQAWNYFMIHASDAERNDFTNAFSDRWEMQKVQDRAKLPAQLKKELEERIAKLYPNINAEIASKSPEGIASFMKEGGIEDILNMLLLFMGGIYAVVGGSQLLQWGGGKLKNSLKKTNPKEKYNEKRTENRNKLSNLLADAKRTKNWKGISTALVGMSILSAKEKKNLSGASSKEKVKIINEMVNQKFLVNDSGESLGEMKGTQDKFWACVTTAGVNVSEMRGVEMGEISNETKIKKAKEDLTFLQKTKKSYDLYHKTHSSEVEFYQIKGTKLSDEFWKTGENKNATKAQKALMTDFLGKEKNVLSAMKTLGVHENEIELCKDISKKAGEQRTFVMKKIDELLSITPST